VREDSVDEVEQYACTNVSDVMGWPQTYCKYPTWLSRMAWVELDGQNVFTIDNASHVIRVGVRTAEVTSEPTVLKSLRCLRLSVDRKSNAASVFVALAFVSNVWYVRVFIRLTTTMLY